MKKRNLALVAFMAPVLAACGTYLDTVKSNPPVGDTAFTSALYSGYVKLSEMEFAEYDRGDGYSFAKRAAALSEGKTVYPEEIDARNLPLDRVNVMSSARERLMKALNSDAVSTHPQELANAQVAFDCWMQEQEENKQPEHIKACQADFIAAMDHLKPAKMAAPAPAPAPEPVPAPAPKAEPAPVMKKPEPKVERPTLPTTMKVYFDFDSAMIRPQDRDMLTAVRKVFSTTETKSVKLIAHADRAGDTGYNLELAEKRAAAVKLALIDLGLRPGQIYVDVRGEDSPIVQTPDGQRELENRVVRFAFSY